MVDCDDFVCKECFVIHFTLMIEGKSFKDFTCPVCGEPDMSSDTTDIDLYLEKFGALIKAHLAKDLYDLFKQIVRQNMITKHPNFQSCIKVRQSCVLKTFLLCTGI